MNMFGRKRPGFSSAKSSSGDAVEKEIMREIGVRNIPLLKRAHEMGSQNKTSTLLFFE